MEFTEQKFSVTTGNLKTGEVSREEVTGYVAEGTGLGYHSTIDERDDEVDMPTHLASGYALGPRFYFESDVRAYIEAVAPLTDWARSAKDLFEDTDLIAKMRSTLLAIVDDDISRLSGMNKQRRRKLLQQAKEYAGAKEL